MTRAKFGEWQAAARAALAPVSENAGLEAQVLLAHAVGQPRSWVLAHPETELSDSQQASLAGWLAQLVQGTPLPYLTGEQEFFGLSFFVSPAVLIPRPETELLVERALDWIHAQPTPGRAADIGAGSGCIAVTLAQRCPGLSVDAVDRSSAALQVAAQNARRHGVSEQVHLVQGDLLDALSGPYSLICANLPYIPSATLAGLPVARYEPLAALDGGPDGLFFIRRLLEQSPRVLANGACILLEIEYRQAAPLAALAQEILPRAAIQVHQDLAGLDRLVEIHL